MKGATGQGATDAPKGQGQKLDPSGALKVPQSNLAGKGDRGFSSIRRKEDIVKRAEPFRWNEPKNLACVMLASGSVIEEVVEALRLKDFMVVKGTIIEWRSQAEFMEELDRLTLMVGIASRAERIRIAQSIVRQRIDEETGRYTSEKDLLEWLKYVQSETTAIPQLGLASLLEAFTLVAGRRPPATYGQSGTGTIIEGTVTNGDDGGGDSGGD